MTDENGANALAESARSNVDSDRLLDGVLDGQHRALARTISVIENRQPGYRELVSSLYAHAGHADVIGITGSPGAGKSTLVDKLAERYRERGETVGIVAIDPSSPFTGGAVLGDRIRMASTVGDMDVFVRSMSARGTLGGLSTATTDAVTAMDAFGKDKIIIETVGAGQNEIDIVRAADTVAVLVPPGSGDAVQTLKAGILEIADVFVVNKADRDGAERTVQELLEMIELDNGPSFAVAGGHHGPDEMGDPTGQDSAVTDEAVDEAAGETADGVADEAIDEDAVEPIDEGAVEAVDEAADAASNSQWRTPIVETVATSGDGIDELVDRFSAHRSYLEDSGGVHHRRRRRHAEEIRTLLREDLHGLLAARLETIGGVESLADAVVRGETDPYSIADEVLSPVESCLEVIGEDDDR